ncbi:hypothetical protein N7467_012051 [Penicillium canescens]|nr:hypothetical protein N7467_012051 [Penicillium canescens]
MANSKLLHLKALFFDVFGTTVDWRSSVVGTLRKHTDAALERLGDSLSPDLRVRVAQADWPAFAEAWRLTYVKFTRGYPHSGDGQPPFKTVDQHYYESLVKMLEQHGFDGLWLDDEVTEISRVWHTLDGWSDAAAGLEALNNMGLQTCTLSNGNISLLEDMAEYAKLPWTHIFSSEHFGAYKPSKEVYLGAVEKVGFQPEECAMVAAHLTDLYHAKKYGLRTIYIERELEEGWDAERVAKAKDDGWVDIWISLGDGEKGKQGFLELTKILAFVRSGQL